MASLYLPSCSALVPRPKWPNPLSGTRFRSREKQLNASSFWTPSVVRIKRETECPEKTLCWTKTSGICVNLSLLSVILDLMSKTTVSYRFWGSENKGLQEDNSGWDRGTAWTHMPLSIWLLLVEAIVTGRFMTSSWLGGISVQHDHIRFVLEFPWRWHRRQIRCTHFRKTFNVVGWDLLVFLSWYRIHENHGLLKCCD